MNNYCLRRIRYALNLSDTQVLEIFALAAYKLTPSELKSYLLKEELADFVLLPDYLLVIFLDGLIIQKRGIREGQEPVSQAERVAQSKQLKLNNNIIVNKLKIALSLNTDDLIEMLALADFRISKSEMSAFFRKPDHRNYRECGNQLLRNLLTGMTIHYQSEKTNSDAKSKTKANSKTDITPKTKKKSKPTDRAKRGSNKSSQFQPKVNKAREPKK